MKLQSMTDFVLQGIDEIDLQSTYLSRDSVRQLVIHKYARFLQTDLEAKHFDPKNPECLFVGFTIEVDGEFGSTNAVKAVNESDFFLGFDLRDDLNFDYSSNEICVGTVENLVNFCDNYGYTIPKLTDYALSKFL